MTTRQDDELGGGGAEPAPFHVLPHSEEVATFLAHQQQQHQHQHQQQNQNYLIHPQQHGQAPGPLMWQPPPHLAAPQFPSHLQQQQPQPHLYNEYLYNLAYSGQPGQPETYSVLPVGHGNFLKVYHCPESPGGDASGPLFTHINMASLNPHQLQHPQAAPPTPPQPTPLYELFATNPLSLPQAQAQQQEAQQRQPQPQQAQTHTPQVIHSPSSANLLINNLVNNWSPNLTGGSYIQFGDEGNENDVQQAEPPPIQQQPATKSILQQPTEPVTQPISSLPAASKPEKLLKTALATATVAPTAINKSSVAVPGHPEGKKRIVAEVKPMPMSYSDVLSKGTKSSVEGGEMRAANGGDYSSQPQRRHGKEDGNGNREMRTAKRSPMHDAKEMGSLGNSVGHAHASRNKKRGQGNQAAPLKLQPPQAQPLQQSTPHTQIKSSKPINPEKKRPLQPKNFNSNSNSVKTADQKTVLASVPSNISLQNHSNGSNSTPATNSSTSSRKSGGNKSSANASHSNHSGVASNLGSTINYSNNNNNVSSSSSKRYSSSNVNLNSNNSSGYSYSSKRNRSNAYSSSSNSPTHANNFASNRNYELAKRILHTWWIYTLKLLTWLFYLVYDIVVLGFSMACERMSLAYVAGLAYARQLHKELKQNSGKPSIWWRSYWRRFDARFAKNSRWAVWRRFYKRKPPEPTQQFKTGRLPQTGEEAMYSLLNCKGKDAYSILGVPPDSPQEQIRKHYKKIAVLVHPDKNKQAGAEEAFKVLQRAFELIGEPENRLIYDQSIAETLHAEKAWTELHDLLSQLQTKMAEAANTIRCSTCAQRHPRKLTERPHYAARECASCKIRHSAKDGDIWAETSMMGLRWKYLALMDGKVYDITEWANCQKGALSHLEPNSHMVQYRIVRGAQQQQQQQQQQQHHQQPQQPHHDRGAHHPGAGVSGVSEATLHEFLDNLYSGQHPGAPNAFAGNTRRRTRRN
ncbi:ras guanine nucleotide exchange factor P [Drosophila ficusphila]|uniref:ras guanine nucleotide exchange factor P n=1 Tax=Drosophila ficusphila TaxID=30025 RepID=UPI0007E72985|nr:ras guanine nucleotide exchange factor P [Drosophila ficusphila]